MPSRHHSNKARRKPVAGNKRAATGQQPLRIIGGQWRGRKLPFADAPGLRPTMDRVRETLFNWLQMDIEGARCLDLFSGSGALAYEALSRGASQLVLVEKSPQVARFLSQNLATLNCQRGEVVVMDALDYLAHEAVQEVAQESALDVIQQRAPFDLVFLDPPFHQSLLQQTLDSLFASSLLTPESKIYLEAEIKLDGLELPEQWMLIKEKKAGSVYYGLLAQHHS